MPKSMLKYSIVLLLLVSCTQGIELNNHFDKSAPITVLVSDTVNKKTAPYEVDPNASAHARFINWIEENQDGSRKSPASYIGDIMVKQKDFTLLRLRNKGVMISFSDGAGKPLQYTKDCDKEELEFLKHQ